MNKSIKKLLILTVAIVSVVGTSVIGSSLLPASAGAETLDNLNQQCDGAAAQSAICRDHSQVNNSENPVYGPNGVVTRASNIIAMVGGIVAVIMIIWAGLKFIMSTGDSAKTTSARNTIIYTAIGLAVIVLARAVVWLVLNSLK